ncbi:uncharacterized protein TNCV_499351 [Trichonephila clavipes]|nr:uncharacterized protein TNCV_499351 [Trichonephila clavipes]
MAPHTITPAVGAECRCQAKAELRRSPRDLYTIVITAQIELKTTWFHSAYVQYTRARHHSRRRRRWVGINGSTRNGRHLTKCPSARCLRMVREHTRTPSEGATRAWMAVDETVGCMRAFFTVWRTSRRLVCRERLEQDLRVNDISRIHWSQHLLKHNQSGLIDKLLA